MCLLTSGSAQAETVTGERSSLPGIGLRAGSILSHRIAIDIGGTFTDLLSLDETSGELLVSKDSTTPADFA